MSATSSVSPSLLRSGNTQLNQRRFAQHFRPYDLRHTYGTRAIESGTDPLTLMRLMGHADLKTTARYVHLSKRHRSDAQRRIEEHRAAREIAAVEAQKGATLGAVQ